MSFSYDSMNSMPRNLRKDTQETEKNDDVDRVNIRFHNNSISMNQIQSIIVHMFYAHVKSFSTFSVLTHTDMCGFEKKLCQSQSSKIINK